MKIPNHYDIGINLAKTRGFYQPYASNDLTQYNTHSTNSLSDVNDKVVKYQNLMYTITIAILTFGLSAKESLILLLPYAIILPLSNLINSLRHDVCKISAYIVCFEKNSDSYLWEKRVQEYDLLINTQGKHPSLVMESSLAFISTFCSIYKCIELQYQPISMTIRIIISIVCLLYSLYFIKTKKVNYYEERKKQIHYWETVKEYESSKQDS